MDIEDQDVDPNETITIVVSDDESSHRFSNEVTVAVNGVVVKVPIGVEHTTVRAVAHALDNASVGYTEVGASADGVSAGASAMIAGEGDRDEMQADPQIPAGAEDAEDGDEPQPHIPELNPDDPGTVHIETDVPANQITTGDTDAGSTLHMTGSGTADANGGDGAGESAADTAGDTHDESQDEQDTSALDNNLSDLTDEIAKLDTVEAVDQHIDAEKAGKNRVGAIDMLEKRRGEIEAAQGGNDEGQQA